jgi:hypothetical protein
MSGLLVLHWILYVISFHMLCILGTIFVLSQKIFFCCLEKILKVFHGDDRISTSSGCFSILVILSLSLRTGLILPHMLGLDSGSLP